MALHIERNPGSVFARKNSLYFDLPKSYQTSQYEPPICEHGRVDILTESGPETVGVTSIH